MQPDVLIPEMTEYRLPEPYWRRYPVAQHQIAGPELDRRLEHLIRVNVEFLIAHPKTPPLYQSGVRYRRSKLGEECWLPIPRVLESFWFGGATDCKSLASWRAAELRVRGDYPTWRPEPARCFWTVTRKVIDNPDRQARKVTPKIDLILYHVLVRRADGSEEDPSALLGMGTAEEGR